MEADSHKRIAKNTFALYMRMLLLMFISFYTSRVVLNALGVTNYGIYNVVGGIVGFLSFFNSSLSLASNRYLSYALGKKDLNLLHRTFCVSLQLHVLIAIVVAILCETVGLWYFHNYLNIPDTSRPAAMVVFQISVVTCAIGIINVPFTAITTSHEHMTTYAYISILEGILKLAVAFMLTWILYNKLELYAWLNLGVVIILTATWVIYCLSHYPQSHYKPILDRALTKEMTSFISWQFIGSISWLLRAQGVALVLNMFFGPVLNAARTVAVQVNAGITTFVNNFQRAVNPQLVKTFASSELQEMNNLIFKSSKFSFLMLLVLAMPILAEIEPILRFWLKVIPDYAVSFVRLMIIATLADALSGTLSMAALATSKIRNYQLTVAGILIFDVFLVYLAYKCGLPPQWMFYVEIALYLIVLVARIILLGRMIGLNRREYVQEVLLREFSVALLAALPTYCLAILFSDSVLEIIATMAMSFLITALLAYTIGLKKNERAWISNMILSKIKIKRKD